MWNTSSISTEHSSLLVSTLILNSSLQQIAIQIDFMTQWDYIPWRNLANHLHCLSAALSLLHIFPATTQTLRVSFKAFHPSKSKSCCENECKWLPYFQQQILCLNSTIISSPFLHPAHFCIHNKLHFQLTKKPSGRNLISSSMSENICGYITNDIHKNQHSSPHIIMPFAYKVFQWRRRSIPCDSGKHTEYLATPYVMMLGVIFQKHYYKLAVKEYFWSVLTHFSNLLESAPLQTCPKWHNAP